MGKNTRRWLNFTRKSLEGRCCLGAGHPEHGDAGAPRCAGKSKNRVSGLYCHRLIVTKHDSKIALKLLILLT